MKKRAVLFALLLTACESPVASDAAPTDSATDASTFETSAESAVPPLPDLDARADG